LAAMFYGPCSFTTYIDNKRIEIDEITDYPFDETITIKITAEAELVLSIKLRIPGWSKKTIVCIDGSEGSIILDDSFCTISRTWKGESLVRITFVSEIETVKAVDGTIAVQRGPLLYSLQIPHTETLAKKYELDGFYDTEYFPCEGTYWDYTMVLEKSGLDKGFVFKRDEINSYIWDSSSVWIEVKALEATPNYTSFESMSEAHKSFILHGTPNESVKLTLVPIGCTTLRKTSFRYVTL